MYNAHDREEKDKRFYGNRRGVVVDNNDPLNAKRIKVQVFHLFDDYPVEDIPWAIYADPFMGGLGDEGSTFVPNVGTVVWVFFEEGMIDQPVYWSGAPSRLDGPAEAQTDYPNNRVIKTKAGHVIELDDQAGNTRIRIRHQSGTQTETTDEGNRKDDVVSNLTSNVAQDRSDNIGGNLTIMVDGNVVVDCTKATVTGSDSVLLNTPIVNTTGNIDADGNISDLVGSMQEMRDIFNSHNHIGDNGGSTSTPNQSM